MSAAATLWVWYKTDDTDELQGGHVAAWTPRTPKDEQGTPTGPTTWALSGLADCLTAAQLVEGARNDPGLLWLCPSFDQVATLDNLIAIWGDDVVSTAVTHNGRNPTVPTETDAETADVGDGDGASSLTEPQEGLSARLRGSADA
jgi:hypothetical protein